MMLVQCISSRHFMRDEKFHVVLCSPRTRYWRRHWVSRTIIRNVLGHVPQLFTHIWCGDCQFKIGFYASCSTFLATWTHVHVRYYAVACPPVVCLSAVCNGRAPYSAGWNFRHCFYAMWYLAIHWHPWKILRRSFQGNPSVGAIKRKRGSQI